MKFHIFELRMIASGRYSCAHNLSSCEIKAWKKHRPRTYDLCDTGAVLYQLSYESNWELITLWVRKIPVEGEESTDILRTHEVSAPSWLDNSVEDPVHGDSLVPFPRLFPERYDQSWSKEDLEPVESSKWNTHFPTEIFGIPFKKPRFPDKISIREEKIDLSRINIPSKISGFWGYLGQARSWWWV